jgi:hypothetical protein
MVGADVPHRRLGTAYQNQKQALRDIGFCQVFFGQLMLALPGLTNGQPECHWLSHIRECDG